MRKHGIISGIGIAGLFLLMACASPEVRLLSGEDYAGDVSVSFSSVPISYAEGAELFCLSDSETEAIEIARMYDIELVEFNYKVATFHTEEDPADVIQRGKDRDYPLLSINQVIELDDPVAKPEERFGDETIYSIDR